MATSVSPSSPLAQLLRKSHPSAISKETVTDIPANDLIKSVFPAIEYTESEKAEINQWLITSTHLASADEDTAKTTERLSALNTHMSTRSMLLGSKPSLGDIALYSRLAPVVAKWTAVQRTGEQGYHHIVRHLDFVQNSPLFGLKLSEAEKFPVNTDEIISTIKAVDPKAEKERKKKEKEAAIASGNVDGASTSTLPIVGGRKAKKEAQKEASKPTGDIIAAAVGASTPGVAQPSAGTPKEANAPQKPKKEKQPKPQKNAPAPDKPLSPSLIDLRVGHILKAEQHRDADSLYVSTIACGDPPGTDDTSEYEGKVVRTVCSGLNGLVPLEEMQGRKIIAVCNLKPVKMRGIKSAAMVLAASPRLAEGETDSHKGPVELVTPPEGAEAGDRVVFEGWEEGDPDPVLNPKKKVWETCQVGFTTTEGCEVGFDAGAVPQLEGKSGIGRLKTKGGLCTVKSLKGATVR